MMGHRAERPVFIILTKGVEEEMEALQSALRRISGVVDVVRIGEDTVKMMVRFRDSLFSVLIYPVSVSSLGRLITTYLNDWNRPNPTRPYRLLRKIFAHLGRPASERLPAYILVEIVPSPAALLSRPKEHFVMSGSGKGMIFHRIWGQKATEPTVSSGSSACIVVDRRMRAIELARLIEWVFNMDNPLYNMERGGGA